MLIDNNDIVKLFQYFGLHGKLTKKILEKDAAVRAQNFEEAAAFRDQEKRLKELLTLRSEEIEEIANKFMDDDNRSTDRDSQKLPASAARQANAGR